MYTTRKQINTDYKHMIPNLFIAGCLLAGIGCKPLCVVNIKKPIEAKSLWFGSNVELKGRASWQRVENYTGCKIFIEPIDTSILLDCGDCSKVENKLHLLLDTEFISTIKSSSKKINIVDNPNYADYTAVLKISSAREIRNFWRIPAAISVTGNHYGLWFKIVNRKTGKTAFAYTESVIIDNKSDVVAQTRLLAKSIDDFERNQY